MFTSPPSGYVCVSVALLIHSLASLLTISGLPPLNNFAYFSRRRSLGFGRWHHHHRAAKKCLWPSERSLALCARGLLLFSLLIHSPNDGRPPENPREEARERFGGCGVTCEIVVDDLLLHPPSPAFASSLHFELSSRNCPLRFWVYKCVYIFYYFIYPWSDQNQQLCTVYILMLFSSIFDLEIGFGGTFYNNIDRKCCWDGRESRSDLQYFGLRGHPCPGFKQKNFLGVSVAPIGFAEENMRF